jgi:hypothetical protein
MRKRVPLALLILGGVAMVGGFLYAAAEALPYQDPTAEMLARQAARVTMCNLISASGLLAAATGGVWLWLGSRTKKRHPNSQ